MNNKCLGVSVNILPQFTRNHFPRASRFQKFSGGMPTYHTRKKGALGPFYMYQLQRVLAIGRHVLQILLKALYMLGRSFIMPKMQFSVWDFTIPSS